jgi:hypothetical protein
MDSIGRFLNLFDTSFQIKNEKGEVVYKENELGEWERNEYNIEGELVYREKSNGEYEFKLDAFGLVKRYKTDYEIIKSSEINNLNIESEKSESTESLAEIYNKKIDELSSQIITQKDSNGNVILEINEITTTWNRYIYDEKNNLLFFFNSSGYWERKQYNSQGQLTYHERSFDDGSPKAWWENRIYDQNNNLIEMRNSEKEWESYLYDDCNNLITFESSFGIIEQYDKKRRIISRKDSNSVLTYDYNDDTNSVYITNEGPEGSLWRILYYDSTGKNIIKEEKGFHSYL